MTFNRLETAPNPEDFVEVPHADVELDESRGSTIPSLDLFSSEIQHWRKVFKEADQEGDAVLRTMAGNLRRTFSDLARGRWAIARVQELNIPLVGGDVADTLAGWYATTTSSIAYSRLWREVSALPHYKQNSFGVTSEETGIGLDYDTAEPHKSGIHVRNDALAENLGFDPPKPKTQQWYEGESVYLRAVTPAQPTATFTSNFSNFFGSEFKAEEFTSITPRLKRDVWEERQH